MIQDQEINIMNGRCKYSKCPHFACRPQNRKQHNSPIPAISFSQPFPKQSTIFQNINLFHTKFGKIICTINTLPTNSKLETGHTLKSHSFMRNTIFHKIQNAHIFWTKRLQLCLKTNQTKLKSLLFTLNFTSLQHPMPICIFCYLFLLSSLYPTDE